MYSKLQKGEGVALYLFWLTQTPRQPRKPVVEKFDAGKRASLRSVLKDIVLKVLTVNRS